MLTRHKVLNDLVVTVRVSVRVLGRPQDGHVHDERSAEIPGDEFPIHRLIDAAQRGPIGVGEITQVSVRLAQQCRQQNEN